MGREFSDMKLFWQEFRQNFQTTGAVLPSGRFLARALARYVEPSDRPRRIVEIGPGTGVVTKEILRRLGPADRLDLVELNDQFVARLRQRLEHDVAFAPFASRVRVLHLNVLDLHPDEPYDVAVSGLPLNNFSADMVETLLRSLMSLLRSGGTLSFFEYIGIRTMRSIVSGSMERVRLRGVTAAMKRLLVPHEVRRDWIWLNIPPAWVHHVRAPKVADPVNVTTPQAQVLPGLLGAMRS